MTLAEFNFVSVVRALRLAFRRAWILISSLLLFSLACGAAADALTVDVDRREIRLNETLNLIVRYEGRQITSNPDFSVLNQFEILANNKSTQHSIINGSVSVFTEWRLTLSPNNTGQLLIPPLSLRNEHSKPITITVTEAAKDPISGKEEVFIETFVDKSNVYVQEQFIVTFRLHYSRNVDSMDASPLDISQVRVEELPRADYNTTFGHTTYRVVEYRYAAFADASGVITIPEQVWTIRTTDQPGMNRYGFGSGRFKLHRVKTKELTITVAPKPVDFPSASPWLPAQSVQLEEHWSRSPDAFRVGEPITRTVTIRATGASPEQLPPLFDERGTRDLKFYLDKPSQDKQPTSQGINAIRSESVAIVPNRAGEVVLPEVAITWWNTLEKKVETTVLPARTLQVAPGEGEASAPAAPRDAVVTQSATTPTAPTVVVSASRDIWPWISGVLLLGNLLTLLAWWRSRRATASVPTTTDVTAANIKGALKQVRQACQQRDAAMTRAALLEWAYLRWGERRLLQDIGRASESGEVQRELGKLEAVLFAGAANEVDYALLATTAERLSRPTAQAAGAELPELYKAG